MSKDSAIPYDLSVDWSVGCKDACDADFPYRSIIGSLMYKAIYTPPYIALATRMLAWHVESPSKKRQNALVKLMKYLKREPRLGMRLSDKEENQITVHVDSNWAGEPGSGRRSRTGVVIF